VRAYSKLAEDVNAAPLDGAILNVAPWPLWLSYGDAEWKLFAGNIARYVAGPRPDLRWSDDEVFQLDAKGHRALPSDTPQRRYAWARGLTAMRERITALSQARLVIGGMMEGFAGLVPGVVEEAWLSLAQKKPLYVAGGLGGAARAVCDQLLGLARTEFSDAWATQHLPGYDSALALYGQDGSEFNSLERLGADIGSFAKAGLAQALNNGLDEAENRELMASTDAQRIARLILSGLTRL
jgi:hypothetical protein